jgi:hypothetical protein
MCAWAETTEMNKFLPTAFFFGCRRPGGHVTKIHNRAILQYIYLERAKKQEFNEKEPGNKYKTTQLSE